MFEHFRIVWKGSSKYLRHYIIQEGEISSIFREDAKHGRHGYYPTSIQVYRSENHTTALIVWEKGYGVKSRIQSGAFLTLMSEEMAASTMRPFNLAALPGKTARHATKYFVIWRSDEFSWAGRIIPRSASSDPSPRNVTELDAAVEKEMRAFEIPSLSLCIYRKGKRMLSVAYGFSNLRTEQRATPNNTYRVASISKTITAMAIAELVNRGQLSLDSKVFGTKGILPLLAVDQGHPWLRFITVRHLLEHSSAGWGNQEKIEFNRTPQTKRLNGTALLEFYIRAYAPKFQPGRQHLYSNIAYVILGRVIEEVTLRPYEAFISDVVLQPNHIEARMGKTEAGENEVAYYSPDNANPYTYWSPSKLNAAAGWVMRAEEVSRLFMLIESRKHTWYRLLTQPSDVKRSYGRGLQLGNDGSLYHIGSLAGSEGIGYTRGDLQVAILTNTRGREQGEHTAWMERLCRQFAEHIVIP
ncbi:hypothetical protein Q1695_002944 [Nippostrongylus brasiliensis]|nr:hypothetical protein Q1695_002944 [Nippostrongylus brasiliensis]